MLSGAASAWTPASFDSTLSAWAVRFFPAAFRGTYLTEGQCCSGIHFPLSSLAPTSRPQTSQGWLAHWSRSLFLLRADSTSSLKRPSQGFAGIGMTLRELLD